MYTHKGFTYIVSEDADDDVVKIDHMAETPEGTLISIPFTPYETMTEENFATWVDMGCPQCSQLPGRSNGLFNLRNKELADIRQVSIDYDIDLDDRVVLYTAMLLIK